MIKDFTTHETKPEDIEQILALYPHAFPDEDLRPVVSALLPMAPEVLSLAAFDGEILVGHVLFTIGGIEREKKRAALLGPLGVIPQYQQKGVGSLLIRSGLERLEKLGIRQVFVLGDPAYYQRFGFSTERQVLPPCSIPEHWADAWQSLVLTEHKPSLLGRLSLPKPWMDQALWQP